MIVVTTCPRPSGASYLAATLASAALPGPGLPVTVLDDRERRGSRHAMWEALRMGAAAGAERLLVLQDDVLACRNLVRFTMAMPIPADVGVVNFHEFGDDFLPWETPTDGWHKFGAHRIGSSGMCGAQALLFPGEHVRWLAAQDPFAEVPLRTKNGSDYAVGWLTAQSPRPFKLFCRPALLHHVGEESTCHAEFRAEHGHQLPRARARPLAFDCMGLLEQRSGSAQEVRA